MGQRAPTSGITLDDDAAAIIKGMLARGDRQHDIAAWFGVNGGRVAEIATGQKFESTEAAGLNRLPPQGPYLSGRQAAVLLDAIRKAKHALAEAEDFIRSA